MLKDEKFTLLVAIELNYALKFWIWALCAFILISAVSLTFYGLF